MTMAGYLGSVLPTETPRRVYLDESGTLGYGGELFTMAFVLVRDLPKLESCTLKHRVTQSEVKASQMKTAQKLALARTLLEENDIQVYLARLDPIAAMVCERKLDKEFLYDSMVAQGLVYYFEQGALERGVAYRLSMDMRGGLRESYEDMVGQSVGSVLMHREVPFVSSLDVRFLDSRYSAGVQAADLFSNIYRTALTQTDSPCIDFLRKYQEGGRVHEGFAFGLPELADQMAQIAADLRACVELERRAEGTTPENGAADESEREISADEAGEAAPDAEAAPREEDAEASAAPAEAGAGTSRSARRRRSRAARRERDSAAGEPTEQATESDGHADGAAAPAASSDAARRGGAIPAPDGDGAATAQPAKPAPHDESASVADKPAGRRERVKSERAASGAPKQTEPATAAQPAAASSPEAEPALPAKQPAPAKLPFAPVRDIRPGRSARMRQSIAAQKRAAKLAAREQQNETGKADRGPAADAAFADADSQVGGGSPADIGSSVGSIPLAGGTPRADADSPTGASPTANAIAVSGTSPSTGAQAAAAAEPSPVEPPRGDSADAVATATDGGETGAKEPSPSTAKTSPARRRSTRKTAGKTASKATGGASGGKTAPANAENAGTAPKAVPSPDGAGAPAALDTSAETAPKPADAAGMAAAEKPATAKKAPARRRRSASTATAKTASKTPDADNPGVAEQPAQGARATQPTEPATASSPTAAPAEPKTSSRRRSTTKRTRGASSQQTASAAAPAPDEKPAEPDTASDAVSK